MTGRAKLTFDQAEQIRARITTGERGYDLATEFGVNKSTISNIWTNRLHRRDPVRNVNQITVMHINPSDDGNSRTS